VDLYASASLSAIAWLLSPAIAFHELEERQKPETG
jgi:hypothetical protein